MNKDEFVNGMKELGWEDEYIAECIESVSEAIDDGIRMPFELFLIEAPITD